jgi:hypothetical protein
VIIGKRASVLECGGPPPLFPDASVDPEFTNENVYAFARELEKLHPDNRHIRDKIRQRLQVLPPSTDFGATSRDAGSLLHTGGGVWRSVWMSGR